MAADNVQAAGPSPQQFAGDSPGQVARRLIAATRPKFFPASVLPVIAGSAWGFQAAGHFDAVAFMLAMLATVCVHAGANVLNDVGDDAGGTDRQNADRIYPYTGGSRFIQAGIMTAAGMARLGVTLLAVAAVAGLALLVTQGAMVLWLGIAGVLLAVLYSLGPFRLASLGLGELAVGLAFGVIPVTGAAWLQSGIIDPASVLFSLPISAWVMAILLINEVPDIAADAATGKRTLPVRLGLRGTSVVYLALLGIAAAAVAWQSGSGDLPIVAALVPLGLLVMGAKAAAAIRLGVQERTRLTAGIEMTLAIHTIGCIWLTGLALFLASPFGV